jgi:hypothetical protein
MKKKTEPEAACSVEEILFAPPKNILTYQRELPMVEQL